MIKWSKTRRAALLLLLSSTCWSLGSIWNVASAENGKNQPPKVAIIIDDIGYNLELGIRAAKLDAPINLAVLPYGPNSIRLAELGHTQGKEIILHAPMSAHHHHPLDEGGLTQDMDETTFRHVLVSGIRNVPHVKGLNNHMGSKLTELSEPMSWLMSELKGQQLFFVDSRTTSNSVATQLAKRNQVPYRSRDVFLDHDRNTEQIRRQLVQLIKVAEREGSAVGIGHPYPETLDTLEKALPIMKEFGVKLVPVSELLTYPRAIPSVVFADLNAVLKTSTANPKPN